MPTCCVKGCKSRSDQRKYKSVRFFSFPQDEKYKKIWIEISCMNNINMKHDVLYYNPTSDEMNLLEEVEQFTEAVDVIEKEGMVYIAGYVAHRFKHKYEHLGQRTQFVTDPKYNWIHAVSRGGCMYPSDDLITVTELMNNIFEEYHGPSELRKEPFIFTAVTDITIKKMSHFLQEKVPREVVACLVRTRTYIRLREYNKTFYNKKKDCNKKSKQQKNY